MKDTRYYTCNYCFKEFEPKRRRVQKYCSNSCRSKAHHARKSMNKTQDLNLQENQSNKDISKASERMSLAGVGNATAGSLIAEGIKVLAFKKENRPATKGDLKLMIEKFLGRYHLVKNLPANAFGQYPYYDIITNEIVYLQNEV